MRLAWRVKRMHALLETLVTPRMPNPWLQGVLGIGLACTVVGYEFLCPGPEHRIDSLARRGIPQCPSFLCRQLCVAWWVCFQLLQLAGRSAQHVLHRQLRAHAARCTERPMVQRRRHRGRGRAHHVCLHASRWERLATCMLLIKGRIQPTVTSVMYGRMLKGLWLTVLYLCMHIPSCGWHRAPTVLQKTFEASTV